MTRPTTQLHPRRRHVALLVLLVLALYVVVPQIGDFRSSWRLLSHPAPGFTALAILLTGATFAAGAGTYCFLAFRRLNYARTTVVQIAANFVNRLLPAGIGALGANYLYLRHEHHSGTQAGSVVAINNLLGFVGHGLILLLTLVFFAHGALDISGPHHHLGRAVLLEAIGILIIGLIILLVFFGRRRVLHTARDIKRQLWSYRQRPLSLMAALGTSICLTLCNVLALLCCLHALSLHLPFAAVLLVFSFGVGTGSAVPTPGGLGGFEAGLAAGFVAYGIEPAQALAVALLYRFISYWLPLLGGAGAFAVAGQRNWFAS
ncbi:MAG TPA: lysylphosphatidylglycerol synthase transmembrane domain-containing protein [Candidatus Saccharimonadales bacterium]|nr:lysylphosphatidylglycerol synthase transmembrane domain-containing protein [Candidatus Saccharimonadales bacterium]